MHFNIEEPKYTKQIFIDLKEEIDSYTIIVVNFNTQLLTMDRSLKKKISNETLDTLVQMSLTDIYTTFHLRATEYIFFSGIHGIFSRIESYVSPQDKS